MPTIKNYSKYILAASFLIIAGASYVVLAKTSATSFDNASSSTPWNGKSGGPIQVRVLEVEKDGDVVTLEGQVTSKLDNIHIEWKLPEGVSLVTGTLEETVTRSNNSSLISRTMVVKVAPGTDPSRLVFFAYVPRGNEKVGTTYVHNLRETAEEKEKTQKIRQFMKSRNSSETH